MRKTVKVAEIVERANLALAVDSLTDEYKAGICSLLEHILHEADAYKGFAYRHLADPTREHSRVYFHA